MFTLSGRGSQLETILFPNVDVSHGKWEIALVSLATYNSIPNVEAGVNNRLRFGKAATTVYRTGRRHARSSSDGLDIIFPEGIYQVDDIYKHVVEVCKRSSLTDLEFQLYANNNTFRTELYSSTLPIDFTGNDTIGPLIGFTEKRVLQPGVWHIADSTANIQRANAIRVVCNVAHESFDNRGRETHALYSFFPTVEPGFQIIEAPVNLTYLPVYTKQLKSIKVHLEDSETGRYINLRDEPLTVRLHLRPRQQ